MKIRTAILAILSLLGTSTPGAGAAADRTYTSNYENVLGTSLQLTVRTASHESAARAEHAVLAEIARQSRILSSWDPNSEVSRWARTRGEAVRVSPELFDMLDLFDQWRSRSHGVIDPAAQAALAVWTNAAAAGRLPTDTERLSAVAAIRQPQWTLDRDARTATRLSSTPLVFASFTKAYIMDKAAAALGPMAGIHGVVLNVGGDILARGAVAEPIDIANPRDDAENATPLSRIAVRNRTVATSGDYRRGVTIGATHYSHIVDPRTALPATSVISATVVAPQATDAGALATAFTVITPAESAALAATVPGADYLLITPDGRRIASPGWAALETAGGPRTATAPEPSAAAPQGAFDATMELVVDFEIPVQPRAAKRPFIALWIEDADKYPVRTIALWYHEDRWLPESKAWYRADALRSMSENTSIVRSIGAATRAPGKYTLKWDGKDNAGHVVKAGAYTVLLEVRTRARYVSTHPAAHAVHRHGAARGHQTGERTRRGDVRLPQGREIACPTHQRTQPRGRGAIISAESPRTGRACCTRISRWRAFRCCSFSPPRGSRSTIRTR